MVHAVKDNGGRYAGDLTKQITHLVARVPEGKKYEYATKWGIKVVSGKWLKDSVKRRMILDESLYHPSLAEAEQGRGALVQLARPKSDQNNKHANDDDDPVRPRKLRRVASAKLGSQSESLLGAIVNVQQNEGEPGELHRSRSMTAIRGAVLEPESFAGDTNGKDRSENEVQRAERRPHHERGIFSGLSFVLYGFSSKQVSIPSARHQG